MSKVWMVWALSLLIACSTPQKTKLVVVELGNSEALNAGSALQQGIVETASLIDLLQTELDPHSQIWIHIPEKADWDEISTQIDFSPLAGWYRQGGKLLLSGFACHIPALIGLESVPPEARPVEIDVSDMGTKYGFQGFRDHPVFAGLWGGVHTFHTDSAFVDWRVAYFDSLWPQQGKVIAIEKQHFFYQHQTKALWEYTDEKGGKIVCIGGFLHFDRENLQQLQANRLVQNALAYLDGETFGIQPTRWFAHDNRPKPFAPEPFACEWSTVQSAGLKQSQLSIGRTPAQKHYCETSGKRILVMGKETGGIDEIWVHPFRALRHLDFSLVEDGGRVSLKDLPVSFVIRPESFQRRYTLPQGELFETVFADRDLPAGSILLENKSDQPLELAIESLFDLRIMWPYEQNVLGPVFFGYDSLNSIVHIRDSSGSFYCLLGTDRKPAGSLEKPDDSGGVLTGAADENAVHFKGIYTVPAQQALRIVFSATDQGRPEAMDAYRALAERGSERYDAVVDYYDRFLAERTVFHTPDSLFNASYLWKLVAIDRFFVETPPYGTAMFAGMGTTERGWGGSHRISGRPGYAWYFGRDAVWSCFAVNNYGDFEPVREQLYFFAKFQDLNGKIFHELSTSGGLHFDASDATPLYINLAAHYLKSSGDVKTIRDLWPSLMAAMDYLYSTDTDGDGLIENTRVGHGWIEGGKLYGAHTTFYLAGLWCQALRDAAYMGRAIGKTERIDEFLDHAEMVQEMLNSDFYLDSLQFYSLGLYPGGVFHTEKTVVPSVPMLLGLLDSSKTETMLDEWGSPKFSTDWGVRIVSSESQLFSPRGYHYGSIWPLFTGWASLAEYRYGRPDQAFRHVMSTLYAFDDFGLGYTEEVLNGQVYQPTGVCSHQCWSETNAVYPLISGMLSFSPDALQRKVRLYPQVPDHWPSLRVTNLRVGDSRFDLEMTRGEKVIWTLKLVEGKPIEVSFQVRQDSDWPLKSIELFPDTGSIDDAVVTFVLHSQTQIEITYDSMPEKPFTLVPAVPGQVAQN
ncbi:hypothetical protein JW992_11890 [candidate division KSB1 bacterium]|nr:hypothetical protein [candidate division KSB1 bacterium]